MYISGGQADLLRQVYETKVWRFDSFTLKWEHLTDMPSCRRHHGTCASEGSYFVLGGFGKFRKCLDTFEEYDIEQGRLSKCVGSTISVLEKHYILTFSKVLAADLVMVEVK